MKFWKQLCCLGLAAVAMLWIKEPPIVQDMDEISVTVPETLAREA